MRLARSHRWRLKSDSPPYDVVVWQARSAAQIHLPLIREILLNRCCAVFRIRLLSDDGSDELLESLYAIAVTAKFRVRCEEGDSAMHGDCVSAARSKLITLLYLPLFVAREFGFVTRLALRIEAPTSEVRKVMPRTLSSRSRPPSALSSRGFRMDR